MSHQTFTVSVARHTSNLNGAAQQRNVAPGAANQYPELVVCGERREGDRAKRHENGSLKPLKKPSFPKPTLTEVEDIGLDRLKVLFQNERNSHHRSRFWAKILGLVGELEDYLCKGCCCVGGLTLTENEQMLRVPVVSLMDGMGNWK